MKSLKKKRRIQIIVASFVALAVSTGLIGYAMKDGINFFKSPTEVLAEPLPLMRCSDWVEWLKKAV